ncbi:MAG: N-acetylmuramoyl-L-alanine amidase [Phenylobacterium sp.]|jgi:N-acetylmuramoyl-L-alanine amidase
MNTTDNYHTHKLSRKISQYLLTILSAWLMLATFSANAANNQISGVRVWPSPDSTRIVFDLKKEPKYSYFTLSKPYRLVIDFDKTSDDIDLSQISNDSKIIKRIRQSKAKSKNSLRVVLELTKTIKPVLFPLKPTSPYGNRLVIDLIDESLRHTVLPPKLTGKRDILIAIDAGHGGEDPGSIGGKGTYEKKVTLAIANRLAKLIDAEPGMKSVRIRKSDYYVKLSRRTDIARKRKVDLFMSIHADAFSTSQPNGASVWVLSNGRANSEIGKWMEQRERHSDLLGGAAQVLKDTNNEKYLARALLDMSMEHSMSTGFDVALETINELKTITKMHKKVPQSASLAVLNSPDIPSLLVETGFISNHKEEKLLNSPAHQAKLAKALYRAIFNYFRRNAPEGSYLAKHPIKRHKVKSGESLSAVAKRYRISLVRLKAYNNLSGNMVRIGQVLEIPST